MTEGSLREAGKNAKAPDVDTTLTPEMLVRKYASVVLGLCMAHTKNFHDSEDIMQQVLLKAITRLNTLRDPARVRPWLIRIARRMCIDFHNKRTPLREIPDDLPAPSNPDDEHIESLQGLSADYPKATAKSSPSIIWTAENVQASPARLESAKMRSAVGWSVPASGCTRY